MGGSATHDVRALARVAVAARLVAAAVDHAFDGRDAEVAVSHRPVAGQLRRAAPDVDAVAVVAHRRLAMSFVVGAPVMMPSLPEPTTRLRLSVVRLGTWSTEIPPARAPRK
jgi:hypothetical protein